MIGGKCHYCNSGNTTLIGRPDVYMSIFKRWQMTLRFHCESCGHSYESLISIEGVRLIGTKVITKSEKGGDKDD